MTPSLLTVLKEEGGVNTRRSGNGTKAKGAIFERVGEVLADQQISR